MTLGRAAPVLLLAVFAAAPALSGLADTGAFLADPASELPVKLWAFETFARIGVFGADVEQIGFPKTGPLNNADIVGTLYTMLARPLLGRVGAYNSLIVLQLFLTMLAAWALVREIVDDDLSALIGGVAFALSPVILVYCVSGAVTDMLNLWPYPLAVRHLLRATAGIRPQRNGAIAGVFVGVGFITCPYNVVVFASALVPGALALPLAWRRAGGGRSAAQRVLQTALPAVLATALVAGGYALWMRGILDDPSSQMSSEFVAATRHTPPYEFLEPSHEARYTAYLADYVAVGKGALIERSAASRYYRAFSPGFIVIGLALLGVFASRRRRAARGWFAVAAFCALASTGPFLPLTRENHLSSPGNPAWLLLHHGMPGASILLEPFRYGAVVAMALAVGAAIGAEALARRFGLWVGVLIPVLFVAELVALSPVPVPLPTVRLAVAPVYYRLDALLGPGAIIELPWFDKGSERFNRVHFLNQLVHGRPIADEVIGFPARYLCENQFLATLLNAERGSGPLAVQVQAEWKVTADRDVLVKKGFAGVILTPDAYARRADVERAMQLLDQAGERVYEGERVVYRLR